MRFQHTAARRRLDNNSSPTSRLILCFNTQPPEGGWHLSNLIQIAAVVSTHSRPKAAGFLVLGNGYLQVVSTHSRPKAAGLALLMVGGCIQRFQHTAARRRLGRNLCHLQGY